MEDKVFDLLEKMYIEFSGRFDTMGKDIGDLKDDVKILKDDVQVLKVDVKVLKDDVQVLKDDVIQIKTKIEHEINPKITVLFDGQKQQVQQLERIEKEVSKHEEIILRRVK